MKELVYPAILYKDKENDAFSILVPDLGIATDGKTVEDAFLSAREHLTAMFECAVKLDCEIDAPSPFIKVWRENKENIVILVDALA